MLLKLSGVLVRSLRCDMKLKLETRRGRIARARANDALASTENGFKQRRSCHGHQHLAISVTPGCRSRSFVSSTPQGNLLSRSICADRV